jgi:DNA replication protein DnaC
MTENNNPTETLLEQHLKYLKLAFMREHHQDLAKQAAKKHWSHIRYLEQLAEQETTQRRDRATERRIRAARFPVVKTLDEFNWSWPSEINRLQVQNLFRLQFIETKSNVIFLGGVGMGKTHLASALGYTACLNGNTVLFTTAIDIINTLAAAREAGRMKPALKKYTRPSVLLMDEIGFLPIDKNGADLLFQVISLRYEQGAIVITSNRAFKNWPEIFNNDATLTSAILDRLLHHAETVLIEGNSYRMKDKIES